MSTPAPIPVVTEPPVVTMRPYLDGGTHFHVDLESDRPGGTTMHLTSFWTLAECEAFLARARALTGWAIAWKPEVPAAVPLDEHQKGPVDPVVQPFHAGHDVATLELRAYPRPGKAFGLQLINREQVIECTGIWNRDLLDQWLASFNAVTGLPAFLFDQPFEPAAKVGNPERKRIFGVAGRMGVDKEVLRKAIHDRFSVESTNDLTALQANLVVFELIPELAASKLPAVEAPEVTHG
jgi:hypothetical protein